MSKNYINIYTLLLCSLMALSCQAQKNIPLDKTKSEVKQVVFDYTNASLFAQTLDDIRTEVDSEIKLGVQVPVPKDMAGGYSHERHKRNFFILQKAGSLFQITCDEKYARYIRNNFAAYAKMYPSLPLHPTDRSYATGKIFWQCLNDANWLVYCSQAYSSIYEWLSERERELFESQLFRPMADFLSVENPRFFNRIHNHSTWANAAVGMIGLVMQDEELIQRALYGLENDGIDPSIVDNDGGYIKIEGQRRAGFLAQLDLSFSPDGHFTEGPYYLRYAMTPFLLFSKSLSINMPDLDIYNYRDNILKKAVYALLYETDAKGQFFPINDAQKGMSWSSREVVSAVDIAYSDFGQDPMLLSIAKIQGRVLLDEAGLKVAQDIDKGLVKPFVHKSIAFVDGADGKKGGLGILRTGGEDSKEICLVMKYAAHGMGHGHFDKLSYSLYDQDSEVIQDYGAARWVNIDQKGGGRYLPENQTFAKQSVAHNTVVVNQRSHYDGKVKSADEHSPEMYFFSADNQKIQSVSAIEYHAYPNHDMHRTMILLKDDKYPNPLLIDIFKVVTSEPSTYDLPLWFMGHLLSTNFNYSSETTSLSVLGVDHGYQHLWKEASGSSDSGQAQITWFGNGKFYSATSSVQPTDELIFARPGANDPNFNLRHDPVFMLRRKQATNTVFASVIESHGTYSPVAEIPINPFSDVKRIEVIYDSDAYTVVEVSDRSEGVWQIAISNLDAGKDKKHQMNIDHKVLQWTGPISVNLTTEQ